MARLLHAYLAPARLPDHAALQQALNALKLGLKIDGTWSPDAAPGYLPFILHGEDAGAYVGVQRGATPPNGVPEDASAHISIKWGGDAREHLAALALAAAFIEGFGAVVIAPEEGAPIPASQLKAKAKALADENF
jgi:hypothetical protein